MKKRRLSRLSTNRLKREGSPVAPSVKTIAMIQKPDKWTIVNALDYVLKMAKGSCLSNELWANLREPLDFLNKELELTDIQIVVLAIMVECGEPRTWNGFGNFLGCTRLSIMVYSEEIEEMLFKGWIERCVIREYGYRKQGFRLASGVVTALRHNQRFVSKSNKDLTLQEFVELIYGHISKNMNDPNVCFEDDVEWLMHLLSLNTTLPLCIALERIENMYDKALFFLCVCDYADSSEEGITYQVINNIFPDDYATVSLRRRLYDGSHPLIKENFLEYKCNDGIADGECYVLTSWVKEELLSEYTPGRLKSLSPKTDRSLKSFSLIKEKKLFYNPAEQSQIERLTSLLMDENFHGVQSRLEEEGMRKGFACIFYGAPGTGKTETALQIARQTGRDIMKIEVAGMRDKWVGESEKNIKGVFMRYKELCRNCEKKPILFFNEADAIFGKRIEEAEHSVDKMNNAMQNIILQEIEELEGILIATTNLTQSLDAAFERRFLFKVKFNKPAKEVKAKIWKSMLGQHISDKDAELLASKYDFSGGEIENIVRKRTIDYVLEGVEPTLEKIESYCAAEALDFRARRRVGFTAS